jgi:tetratricopeptide (TPR) repeat protein
MIESLETAALDVLNWVDDRLPAVFPAVAVAGAVVALGWLTRQAVLLYRARSPRVQITPFTWATPGGGDQEALWITSLFREQLNELKLDSLDALPDRAPGAPLVQIVEGVGQGVAHGLDVGRAIARVWRAAFPDSAYEVWATLRPSDDGGGEIAVQLVDRRGNRTLVSAISRDADWKNSARQAAMAVAGALYPRVANRHTGPWTQWDKAVPPELIGLYHGALEHERANRFEQALGGFRKALEMDPLNPNLRIKIAMLEERLDLHLDAWFTYRAIVDEDRRKLWKGPDRRVRMLALYRLAIHLSNHELADQWVEPDRRREKDREEDEHDRALGKLRQELIIVLECDPLLDVGAGDHRPKIAKGRPAELMASLAASRELDGTRNSHLLHPFRYAFEPCEDRVRRIHEVLQIVSLHRLEELYAWQRAGPPLRGRELVAPWIHRRPLVRRLLREPEFSRMAMRTSMRVIRLRIVASVNLAAKKGLAGTERASIEKVVKEEYRKLTRRWPFSRTGFHFHQDVARFFRPRLRWIDRRGDAWQLHYNAACAIGATLLPNSPVESSSRELARRATTELEEYAHRAGSERVAGQADWLVFQDPDLAGLVATTEFRLWAVPHLAFEVPQKRPARDVEVRRYTALVVHRGALAFAKSWQDRAGKGSVPIAMAIEWWRHEEEIWEQISTACRQRRSWRHRLAMLEAIERCAAANGAGTVDLAHEQRDRSASRRMVPHELFDELVTRIQGDEKAASGTEVASVRSWMKARVEAVEAARDENPRKYLSSAGAGLHGPERKAAIAAAQVWTRLAAILELGLERELDGKRYLGDDAFDAAWKERVEDFARGIPS